VDVSLKNKFVTQYLDFLP